MHTLPFISIIVAVYKGSATLQRCLDSVAMQTYPNKELIVMDGGSTDGTVRILEGNSDAITYWESKTDNGIAHAWNKGLQKSMGDWIIFIGADDELHDASVLADMAMLLRANMESDLVYGQIVFGEGPLAGTVLGQPFDWEKHKRRMLIPHTGCFQRSSIFNEIGAFDDSFRIAVDYEIFLRKPSIKAMFIPRLITIMGSEGISTQQAVRSFKEARQAQLKNSVDSKIKIEFWHAIYQIRHLITKLMSTDLKREDSFFTLLRETTSSFAVDCSRNSGNLKMLVALFSFRVAHLASRHRKLNKLANLYAIPVILTHRFLSEWLFCMELPAATEIGKGLIIDHGYALVINKCTVIGQNCRIRHCVTIGCKTEKDGTQGPSPRIGDSVEIGCHAIIIGDILIDDQAIIGAGAVVVKDVPKKAVVAGNPARVIKYLN